MKIIYNNKPIESAPSEKHRTTPAIILVLLSSLLLLAFLVLEFLVGIALFFRHFRLKAAWVAIVIFVLFFPANIYSALNSVGLGGHQWDPAYLFIRAPLQAILIAWTYFLCIKKA